MVPILSIFKRRNGRDAVDGFREALLPQTQAGRDVHSAIPPKRYVVYSAGGNGRMLIFSSVTAVALRLKYLVEHTVPYELKETQITRPHRYVVFNLVHRRVNEELTCVLVK
jgi:hypothetical protein